MPFNSYEFVLFFLPITLIVYWWLRQKEKYFLGKCWLIVASLWFYGSFHPMFLPIIGVSMLVNYGIHKAMNAENAERMRKPLMIGGIVFNVGLLFYFKYYNFFISNMNVVLKTDFVLKKILLPIGVSYFTFQQIAFIVDSYRDEIKECRLEDYILLVTFFPKMIAGPIVDNVDFLSQLQNFSQKKACWKNFSEGIYIFTIGMAKKVLIADTFAKVADWGYANYSVLDMTNAIIVMLSSSFMIYFDFSGYSDMAVGIGKLLHIELPVNFNSPYKATTILDFWKRWHISLTKFLTKYIYIPLGGSRKGAGRTVLNTMIVFLISGLWHGANWTFVLWGACHGAFSVLTRKYKEWFEKLNPVVGWMITFAFFNITLAIFRADSIQQAFFMIKQAVMGKPGTIEKEIALIFKGVEVTSIVKLLHLDEFINTNLALLTNVFLSATLLITLGARNSNERMSELRFTVGKSLVTAALLAWCVMSFAGVSTFVYANF